MKKILLFILAAAFLYVDNTFAATLQVIGNKLNVRLEPDTGAPALETLKKGDIISVIEGTEVAKEDDVWVKIKRGNVAGYIRKTGNGVTLAKPYEGSSNLGAKPSILLADKIIKDVMKSGDKGAAKRTDKERPDIEANIVFVEGEGLHRVEIALKDLNRITCPGKIGDPIYSKDKQIEIVRGGDKDLFVKISPVKTTYGSDTKVEFNDFPREIFVECSGNIYNISLIPKDIPTQTVAIKTPAEDLFKAGSYERASAYEDLITNLLKLAYIEQAPDGYSVKRGTLKYGFKEMDMRLRYIYQGESYMVEDWEITSKMSEEAELEENMFVPVLKTPRAISIVTPRLMPGEKTRLLVVRLTSRAER